jgi:glucokinase
VRPLVGAVDIGATKTLVTVSPYPIESWPASRPMVRFATPRDPVACVERIGRALDLLAGREMGALVAVGCGTPGPLDRERGIVIHSPNQAWRDIPIGPWLSERVRVPVAIDDDARTGALGEAVLGAGAGADPVVYLTISSGIGSGLVLGGALVAGAHGLAGEVGHLVVDRRGPRCTCGNRGCIEAFASGGGLARRARRAWPRATTVDGRAAPHSAADVFRAARLGDPEARRLADEAAWALALGFASLAAVLDPEVIVVGGSVGLARRSFVRRAAALARHRVMRESAGALRVTRAALGGASVLAGAALLAGYLASEEGVA